VDCNTARSRGKHSGIAWLFTGLLALGTLSWAAAQAQDAGATSNEMLLGSWRLRGSKPPVTIRFNSDGTYQAVTGGGVLTGRWALTGNGNMATWSDDGQPKRMNGITVSDDTLVIIDERGRFHKHRRVTP